jgi:branched-chain amino acid transport system substrate-binding protein
MTHALTKTVLLCAAVLAGAGIANANTPNEQFFPVLVFRGGPYEPNGVPWANGFVDYLNLVNARDGGINGVKITHEECETGYATDKGVECHERLKGTGPSGAASFSPLSTGITFALTEKVATDKIPLITMGYGRSESTWNGTQWRYSSDWYESDAKLLRPMMDEAAKKCAADKNIATPDCSAEN